MGAPIHHGLWGEQIQLYGRQLGYPGHQHPEVEVMMVTGHDAAFQHGATLHHITAGSLVLSWGGIPHGYIRNDDALERILTWITIPLSDLQSWRIGTDLIEALLGGAVLADPTPPVDSRRIGEWVKLLHGDEREVRIATLELQALLLRCSQAIGQAPLARDHGGLPQRILTHLHQHFCEAITIDDLAAAMDCHPATAMTAFKQAVGCTILAYLTQLRVAEAARRLLADDSTVIDIALATGFGSQSRFYAAFSKAFGMPPTRYRRLHR